MKENKSIKEFAIGSSKKYADVFTSSIKDVVFEDRGILNSEMLLVCSMILEKNIDVLIESGRFLGQSTEVLAKFFLGRSLIIESIEIFHDKNAEHVEKKLARYGNVHLLYGDAQSLVPDLVRKYKGKNIAILFDGPKGLEAVRIFQKTLLIGREDVKLGFFHDMRKGAVGMLNPSRAICEHEFSQGFFTDDQEFVSTFESLDSECKNHEWNPYKIAGRNIGSYGPTIGMVVPSNEDFLYVRRISLAINMNILENAIKSKLVVLLKRLRGEIK